MGHVWLGFPEDHVRELLSGAGLARVRVTSSSPMVRQEPALFVASARRGPAKTGR